MKPNMTYGEIEIRMKRAFMWLLKDEDGRWDRFRRIRDRYRPLRLPLQWRIEAMLPGVMSQEAKAGLWRFWNTCEAAGLVFEKYRNPDKRCGYPFSPDPCGYCWSFAHHVDGTKGYEDMEKICHGCDLFTPNTGE